MHTIAISAIAILAPLVIAASGEAAETAATTLPVTMSLFDGQTVDGWKIDPKAKDYRIEDGTIVVHGTGHDAAFSGSVGEAGWDHYIVDVDLCVDEPTSPQSQGHFGANLQFLMPEGFVQFFDNGAMNVAWWDGKPESKWNQLDHGTIEHPPRRGEWHRASMIIADGTVTPMWDGRAFTPVRMRGGCGGKVGVMVNFASDATMRLRHLTVTFLRPTSEQLRAARLAIDEPTPPPATGKDF